MYNEYQPRPWFDHNQMWCVRDSDCPQEMQFCNSVGVCENGACRSDRDCTPPKSHYHSFRGVLSPAYYLNIIDVANVNEAVLQEACDNNPECIAYDSLGHLMYKLTPPHLWFTEPSHNKTPWLLNAKLSYINDNSVPMTVKTVCNITPSTNTTREFGMCQQCLSCTEDSMCPSSSICASGCCISNPCVESEWENTFNMWGNISYSRDKQCKYCTSDKPYCCFNDPNSAYPECSENECDASGMVRACKKFCLNRDASTGGVMCAADEVCCNSKDGEAVCCRWGSEDCNVGASTNKCMISGPPVPCTNAVGKTFCQPNSQTCCNGNNTMPPVCCTIGVGTCDNTHNACITPGDVEYTPPALAAASKAHGSNKGK